ncbi:MAG: sulfatase [bacterium]|nr:sulfatase [bacterium]
MRSFSCFLLALAVCLACRSDRESQLAPPAWPAVDPQQDPLVDPQLFSLHPAAYTFFDGGVSSIVPGDGWGPVEKARHQTEEPVTFAWAIDREVTFRVEGPSTVPVDFLARCLPFTFDGAPRQTLRIEAGERTIATRTLERGWQDVRIPLPADALTERVNELRLTFGQAWAVNEVRPGNPDVRRLAVAFQSLAIVPREARNAEAFLGAIALDPRQRRLRLAVGTSAMFPLPAGSEVTLRLGPVSSACRRCQFEITRRFQGREETIWQGEPAEASNLALSLSTPDHALSRLRLALRATGGRAFDARRTSDVLLPPNFLAARQREAVPAPESPHVFIYLIDTLRADALTTYGSQRETSLRIAEFARDAVTYENAWSASSWTLPSVVSILTGVYPYQHQIMQGEHVFSEDNVPSLAALLAESGYETFGISQSYVASDQFGLHTGFHSFALNNQLHSTELRSQEVRRQLLLSLLDRGRPEDPLLAYLHTVDPHGPYAPEGDDRRFTLEAPGQLPASKYLGHIFILENLDEDPREVAHMRALYDGEVLYTDRQFGRFVQMLRFLGLYDDSLIVLLSDHGEEFSEHAGFGHGRTVYEEALRVPLMIKYPRSEWAGTRVPDRVSTVDLVPTILRSAGITGDQTFDGKSIRPPDLEGLPPSQRFVFAEVNPRRSEHFEAVDYRAFALDGIKCIESLTDSDQFGDPVPRWQIFDLDEDPLELQPLATDAPSAERCRGLMAGWIASRRTPSAAPETAAEPEALEELRALGYIE